MRLAAPLTRWRTLALGAVACTLVACGSTSATPGSQATDAAGAAKAPRLKLVQVVSGLDSPVYVTGIPSEPRRLYVVEQPGRIRIVQDGRLLSSPFLDITSLVKSGGEQGLLSVAFSPKYASNRLFYVDYTDTNGDTRVAEYRSRPGGEPVRTRQLLFVDQPYSNHNGGLLLFGPDGRLYVGMGDGGSGGDPQNHAQDLSSRLGKLLALNVGKRGADWQTVGYGLRNPWRYSFDRANGNLYIGDVGQGNWEEVDYVPRSRRGLLNFGWSVLEGKHPFKDEQLNRAGRLVRPIYEYSHAGGRCSITGGYVYRGKAIPNARGRYFFGDYCSGDVWSLTVKEGKAKAVTHYPIEVETLTSFGQNAAGELFLVSQGGTIYRLAQA